MEQGSEGGATIPLESYKSTCDETVPLHPSPAVTAIDKEATNMATVAIETAPLSSPTAAKGEEEEEESKEEPQSLTGAQLEEVKKEEGKLNVTPNML